MIMLCIGAGYTRYCVDGSFFNFVIQTNEDEDNSDCMRSPVPVNFVFVDISHHFFITTHQNNLHHITESTIGSFNEHAVISCKLVQSQRAF